MLNIAHFSIAAMFFGACAFIGYALDMQPHPVTGFLTAMAIYMVCWFFVWCMTLESEAAE